MGIFDKVTEAAAGHADEIRGAAEAGIDKAGDLIDAKTGGKFAGQVDQAQDFAKTQADDHLGKVLHNEQGVVPPVDGTKPAENLPGKDVLESIADVPAQG